jgi:hypothetical protein
MKKHIERAVPSLREEAQEDFAAAATHDDAITLEKERLGSFVREMHKDAQAAERELEGLHDFDIEAELSRLPKKKR